MGVNKLCKYKVICIVAPCLSATLSIAQQQAPIDAGSLQRETQRNLDFEFPQKPIEPLEKDFPSEDAESKNIRVNSFVIRGAQTVSESKLQELLLPYIGKSLSVAELNQIANKIQRYYQTEGWYARVQIPPQDVSSGNIEIEVIEGRWGKSHFTPATEPIRANSNNLEKIVTNRLIAGDLLSYSDLERGLLIANDQPGALVIGVLRPGNETGIVDLNIKIQDLPMITGDIGISNYGLRPTGKGQLAGGISLNNLSGRHDQLSLRFLGSAHLGSIQARYSAPFGADGWRWAFWGSMLHYSLAGPYSSLDANGDAWNYGAGLNYPIIRQSTRNLHLNLSLQQQQFKDDMLDETTRRSHVNALTLGVSGDWVDHWGGGGFNWGGADLILGKAYIREVGGAAELDEDGPKSAGNYSKISANFSRLQNIYGPWQLLISANGQFANKNLVSSERMSLGGPSQVRAYPVNEASGDIGLVTKFQLQNNFAPGWQAQLFYDWGVIRQHKNLWANWDGGSDQPNSYHLSGWGVGIAWQGQGKYKGLRLQASIATPTGRNAGHTNNRNSDGSSLRSTRGWITASYSF